jgi:pimeloyl-ACP methyl ester carboxylesterase
MEDTSAPRELSLDVADRVGEPARIAASYFPAVTGPSGASGPALVCLPGGTYTRRYFDLEVPDHPGYSFARYAAGRGFPVITLDMLGTGESARPDGEIDFDLQASAAAAAVAQLAGAVGLRAPFVGVGHSMGGYVAMFQQAGHHSYAAVAILGTTNQHVAPLGLAPEMVAAAATADGRDALVAQIVTTMPDRFLEAERAPMLPWFHLGDVPSAVVDADTASTLTVVPRGCAAASMVPGVAAAAAATIEVPVFLAYGDTDVSPQPRVEPEFFPASHDITLFLLRGSGHCHNMAGTRRVLWDRQLRWIGEVVG